MDFPPEMTLAICLWIEELGPAFRVPLTRSLYSCYGEVSARQFANTSNAATLRETLEEAQRTLRILNPVVNFATLQVNWSTLLATLVASQKPSEFLGRPGIPVGDRDAVTGKQRWWPLLNSKAALERHAEVIEFQRVKLMLGHQGKDPVFDIQEQDLVPDHMSRKVILWKQVARFGCNMQSVGCTMEQIDQQLETWRQAWVVDASGGLWPRQLVQQRKIGLLLSSCLKVMRAEAMTLRDNRADPDQRQAPLPQTSPSKKRKESDADSLKVVHTALNRSGCGDQSLSHQLVAHRQRFNEGVRAYQSAIARMVSEGCDRPAIKDVADMKAEIKSSCKSLRKAVSKVQEALANCEKLKMANEISSLTAEKAAASAELARVESKAQADIQAVTAACQDRLQTQISCLQAKLKEADVQAAAAAACLHKFELQKAQIEEAAKRKFDSERAQVAAEAREEAESCKICLETPHNVVIYPCSHAHYCSNCLDKHRKTQDTCPTCRAAIIGTVRYIV